MLDIYWSLVIPLAIILVFNISLFVLIKVKVIQRLKLTKNLIVVLLVVTLVPILCIGFVAQRKMSSLIFTNVCEKLNSVGKTRAMFVSEKLEEVRINAESIAKDWIVIEVLRQISIEKANKFEPNFNNMLFKNAHENLNRIASLKGYNDIMLVSAEGKIELTSAEYGDLQWDLGPDVSTEPYFKQGKEKTYFTDLFYHKLTGKNLMYVVTPCLDQQGRFIGCVMAEINMNRIRDVLVDREGLGQSGETYIVNREKLMVSEARFQKDAILKLTVDTFGLNEGLAGKSGVAVYKDYRNIPVIGSWHPVKYTNWVLLAEVDEEEAFVPLGINRTNQIILVSVAVIMVVIIAIFSARATVKPVRELIKVATHIGEGKLDQDVKIQSHDEIGILISVFNEMIRNIRLLAKQAAVISQGNLTANVEAKGELANAFNYMVESLRALIKQTHESIARISSAAMEILSVNEEQTSGAAELAASVAEVTATMEELSASAKQVAFNAEMLDNFADDSSKTAQKGKDAVVSSMNTMESIMDASKEAVNRILSLNDKSKQIGEVLKIINEVSGEIHLLSLNASIEASGAGEYGKRFGVVANEVRRLAERTKISSDEIRKIVEEVQSATNAAVLSTEQEVKSISQGMEIAKTAVQALEVILESIEKTFDASRQIVIATQQQKSASEQVAQTMKEISEVVKQIAAGLKQSNAAIAELGQLSKDLEGEIKDFKT